MISIPNIFREAEVTVFVRGWKLSIYGKIETFTDNHLILKTIEFPYIEGESVPTDVFYLIPWNSIKAVKTERKKEEAGTDP